MDREGYEVTTYRVDGAYEDGRHPKQVTFTSSLEEDLKRRDFTINAMAYHPERGLVDLFHGMEDMQHILKNNLRKVKSKYDFIIIDCPPALGMLTVNALTAANTVLVPIQCEFFALDGLSQLIYTVNLIKKKLNRTLKIEGVVFTMYDSRTNLSAQVVENVRENLTQNIYNTVIPRNVRLAEAPSYGLPIIIYDPRSAGAEHYMMLADEIIENDIVTV